MEKLNKFEEMERKVDVPLIEKKGQLERIAAEPQVIEKKEQRSTHSPSTIPFSGKVLERTTPSTINTSSNPSSRQRSLFSQLNRE
jgi:hypothetical protein